MKAIIQSVTNKVTTKKGMWVTLSAWLLISILLALLAPSAKDYEVTSIESLPEDVQSVIAQNKIDKHFGKEEDIPALLVFKAENNEVEWQELTNIVDAIRQSEVEGLKSIPPLSEMPPQAAASFLSEDKSTALIPMAFDQSMENADLVKEIETIHEVVASETDISLYVTGPAGISTDTLDLFSRADLVLILSTVGLILVLLIIIYRSPLLALIPLLAAGFVYFVTLQVLGIFGAFGLDYSNQTISIMSILLFAATVDYSLFVFSRFREELKIHENKHDAMQATMSALGLPLFISGGTVLAAMLVLFFARLGDYQNFAPSFATTMLVIIISSLTLIPALFALFGRRSFWPKVPNVGDNTIKPNSFWHKVGKGVTKKPGVSVVATLVVMGIAASNLMNLEYDFNLLNSFPDDMESKEGYELIEEKFASGDLAPTTVLFEGKEEAAEEDLQKLRDKLSRVDNVQSVELLGTTEGNRAARFTLTFMGNPYEKEAMDQLETMIDEEQMYVEAAGLTGDLYFAGETAAQVDDRALNFRDFFVIVTLETLLILGMLMFLTKSFKRAFLMMATNLISFVAAIGAGIFLTELFFDIGTISNRVPLYAFVFLVALGIDYSIMLVSRYLEEQEQLDTRNSVHTAIANTGGVISSAGLLLAATFAVLMTQPVQLLFVFGFIVAVGILIDTFIIRGVLLPGLLVLFDKKK
uniref:MMPL family transporter n=1 Tax=uncultured Allobacillus sp. TaxID=1638025 RepID=UPI002592779A|nr:MMPL family transporter [uncultured Allobacillus sp.]